MNKLTLGQATIIDDKTNEHKDILFLHDSNGIMTDRETALKYITLLQKFYNHPEADKFIKQENLELELKSKKTGRHLG